MRARPMTLLAFAALAGLPLGAAAGDLRPGFDLGVLMRDEAGGQHSPLAALNARVSYSPFDRFSLGGAYTFAFANDGKVLSGFSQHHRLTLRPEYALPIGPAHLVLSAGPTLAVIGTRISAPSGSYATSYLRVLATGGLAFDVELSRWRLRAATDVAWAPGRTDVLIWLGASYRLGGAP